MAESGKCSAVNRTQTLEGKQHSKQNSYKAGIFARQLFFPTEAGRNEWDGYKDIAARIYAHYRPQGVMEELLVDKVVTEAVRFARLLWFEREEFARKDAFWGQGSDKVLRYQTAINRQLTKAIEHLEDLQAERMAAGRTGETGSDPESDAVAEEPCDLPWEPASGGAAQPIPRCPQPAGRRSSDREFVERSHCSTAVRPRILAAASSRPAKTPRATRRRKQKSTERTHRTLTYMRGAAAARDAEAGWHSAFACRDNRARSEASPLVWNRTMCRRRRPAPEPERSDVALAETSEQAIFDCL